MGEMVERVAIAIAECHSGRDWLRMSEAGKDWWRDEARAAIKAMREPTAAMWTANQPIWSLGRPMWEWWRDMIDEALK